MSIQPAIGLGPSTTNQGLASILGDLRRRLDAAEKTIIGARAITGTQIQGGTITSENIAANTITAANIVTGVLTAAQISAGSITAELIAAGAIVAVHISAGAILADAIAAGVITAEKIAAGSITSDVIAAGAITTGTIAAGAITADKIASGAISSDKIFVSSLSAITSNLGDITAGQITGATIRTSISGARVVMDSGGIRAYGLDGTTQVFNIDAGAGTATFTGTVTANAGSSIPGDAIFGQVPASAIPNIGVGNFLDDSSFKDATFVNWTVVNATPTINTSIFRAGYSTSSIELVSSSAAAVSVANSTPAQQVAVEPAKDYSASGYFRSASTTRNVRVSITWYDGTGATISTSNGTSVASSSTLWTRATVTATSPSGAASASTVLEILAAGSAETHYIDDAQFEQSATVSPYTPSAAEISLSPGSVGSTELAAGAVIAGKVAAGAISAYNIAAATITAAQIASATITGNQIAAGTITANHILAGSITTNKLAVEWAGPNQLYNSGFEYVAYGTTMQGWRYGQNSSATQTTLDAFDGTYSAAIANTGKLRDPYVLTKVSAATGGTLAAGAYQYYVTAVNAAGETSATAQQVTVPLVPVTNPTVTTTPTNNNAITGGYPGKATRYYKVTPLGTVGENTGNTAIASSIPTNAPALKGTSISSGSGVTTGIIAVPTPYATGDFLMATVVAGPAGVTVPTITPPAGWTQHYTITMGNTRLSVFWKFGVAAESNPTFTFSASSYWSGTLNSFTGVNTSTPFGATGAPNIMGAGTSVGYAGHPTLPTGSYLYLGYVLTTNQTTFTVTNGGMTSLTGGNHATPPFGWALAYGVDAAGPPIWTDTNSSAQGFDGLTMVNMVLLPVNNDRGKFVLTWPAAAGATSYRIYRGTTASVDTYLGSVASGTLTYTDQLPNAGTLSVPPTTNTSSVNTSTETLTWEPVTGATSYYVYRGTGNTSSTIGRIGNPTATTFTDTNATAPVVANKPPANTATSASAVDTTLLYENITVKETTKYTLSAWMKGYSAPLVGKTAKIQAEFFTSAGASLGIFEASSIVLTANWLRVAGTITSPATSAKATLRIVVLAAPTAQNALVDAVQFEQGDVVTPYGLKSDDNAPGTINSTVITPNSITTSQILASGIHGDRIQAATIDAVRMNVGTLSAITANLGFVTAGTIQGVLYQSDAQGFARVEIDTESMRFYDDFDAQTLTVSGGKITTDPSSLFQRMEINSAGIDAYDGIGKRMNISSAGNITMSKTANGYSSLLFTEASAIVGAVYQADYGTPSNTTSIRGYTSGGRPTARTEMVSAFSNTTLGNFAQLATEYNPAAGGTTRVYVNTGANYYNLLIDDQNRSSYIRFGNGAVGKYKLYAMSIINGYFIPPGGTAFATVTYSDITLGVDPVGFLTFGHFYTGGGNGYMEACGYAVAGYTANSITISVYNSHPTGTATGAFGFTIYGYIN